MAAASVPFLLVEDHALFRSSMVEALEDSQRYCCVGSFSTMESALDEVAKGLRADIAMLDLGLPGMDGLEGITCIRERMPMTKVLVLTAFSDRERVSPR